MQWFLRNNRTPVVWAVAVALGLALMPGIASANSEADKDDQNSPFGIPSNQIPGYATAAAGGVLTWLAVFAGFAGKSPCEDGKYLEKHGETREECYDRTKRDNAKADRIRLGVGVVGLATIGTGVWMIKSAEKDDPTEVSMGIGREGLNLAITLRH